MLLADCVYWYRPAQVVDELTHQITKVHKRFQADKWHIDYEAWGEAFGFTKRQVKDAVAFLVKKGVVTRELRNALHTLPNGNTIMVANRVYLEPVPAALSRMHEPVEKGDARVAFRQHLGGSDVTTSDGCDVVTSDHVTLQRPHTRDYLTRDSKTKEGGEDSLRSPPAGPRLRRKTLTPEAFSKLAEGKTLLEKREGTPPAPAEDPDAALWAAAREQAAQEPVPAPAAPVAPVALVAPTPEKLKRVSAEMVSA